MGAPIASARAVHMSVSDLCKSDVLLVYFPETSFAIEHSTATRSIKEARTSRVQ